MARGLVAVVLLAGVAACSRDHGADRGGSPARTPRRPAPTVDAGRADAAGPAAAGVHHRRRRTAPRTAPRPATGRETWPDLITLNPRSGDGQLIYVAPDDSCYVESIQGAPSNSPVDPWHREPVDCPPALDDPAWDECVEGRLEGEPGARPCKCTLRSGEVTVAACPAP